jgi:hypothetical protein
MLAVEADFFLVERSRQDERTIAIPKDMHVEIWQRNLLVPSPFTETYTCIWKRFVAFGGKINKRQNLN